MSVGSQTRIALSEAHFMELIALLDLPVETAAVLAATIVPATPVGTGPIPTADHGTSYPSEVHTSGSVTLLAQTLTLVPEGAYLNRSGFGLSIASHGWVPAFRAAIKNSQVPVFVHTHPGGIAFFSDYDDKVDAELAAAARDLGAPAYASMVVAGRSEGSAVTARLQTFDPNPPISVSTASTIQLRPVDAVRVSGSKLRLMLPPVSERDDGGVGGGQEQRAEVAGHCKRQDSGDVFDRQMRMLGADGQRTLAQINVAIVGAGGTGSAVAVQLGRIGVGSICLVDDDRVTPATPTRGHGMRIADVDRSKVSVLAEHLRDIGLGTHIREINASLHSPEALRAIQHSDVVFSCVDGHGARLILNRFAYAQLAVVIDLAVLVTMTGSGAEVDERVTWLGPGTACLLCRGRLDATLAYAENLSPDERKRLAGEGYVQSIETPQPAVVTLTTLVAALAATEFLLRLSGIGSNEATELLLRPHVGELRRNRSPQRPGCFCSDPRFLARGQKEPYLDLMWAKPPMAGPIEEPDK